MSDDLSTPSSSKSPSLSPFPLYFGLLGSEGLAHFTWASIQCMQLWDGVYLHHGSNQHLSDFFPPFIEFYSSFQESVDAYLAGKKVGVLVELSTSESSLSIDLLENWMTHLDKQGYSYQCLSVFPPFLEMMTQALGLRGWTHLFAQGSLKLHFDSPSSSSDSLLISSSHPSPDPYSHPPSASFWIHPPQAPSHLPQIDFNPPSASSELSSSPWQVVSPSNDLPFFKRMGWQRALPLRGYEVVSTRAVHQQTDFALALHRLGARVIQAPCIEIQPPPDLTPLHKALNHLSSFDWMIFTSVNGVQRFFEALFSHGLDVRSLGGVKIACIGTATAQALRHRGFTADLIPPRFVAESLIDCFRQEVDLQGKRICIPRALVAREILPQSLRKLGAEVDVVPVYQTLSCIPSAETQNHLLTPIENRILTFTARSTVVHFCELWTPEQLKQLQAYTQVICIGPIAGKEAKKRGFNVVYEAHPHTIVGLIQGIQEWIEHKE